NSDEVVAVRDSVDTATNSARVARELAERAQGHRSTATPAQDGSAGQRSRIGPTMPPPMSGSSSELRPSGPHGELMDQEDRRRYESAMHRKDNRKYRRDRDADLEELAPRATGREAMIEKRRAQSAYLHREPSPDVELPESDLMGGGDSYQAHLRALEGAQQRRRQHRQQRSAERSTAMNERFTEHQRKEEAKMAMFRRMAEQRQQRELEPRPPGAIKPTTVLYAIAKVMSQAGAADTPALPQLSAHQVVEALGAAPAVWTTDALVAALCSSCCSDCNQERALALLQHLRRSGIFGRREARLNIAPGQSSVVSLWWLTPLALSALPLPRKTGLRSDDDAAHVLTKDPGTLQCSETQKKDVTPTRTPPEPVGSSTQATAVSPTGPMAKRRRIVSVNKPFKSPLARPRAEATKDPATANERKTPMPAALSPHVPSRPSVPVTPQRRVLSGTLRNSLSSVKTQTPQSVERQTLTKRKRLLEEEISSMETTERRRQMMQSFSRQGKARSIGASIDKWREVCQQMIEQIRSRIDPQAFLDAQSFRPDPPPWMDAPPAMLDGISADGEHAFCTASGRQLEVSTSAAARSYNVPRSNRPDGASLAPSRPSPETLNYRSLLKMLGITRLALLRYNDEDDCFY
ncbi:hypothetical protein THASP1DRAFT_31623, partial [Thamnocephalis sphaerospora]